MGDSNGSKPAGAPRPVAAPSPAKPGAEKPAGRIVHDARGNAVWDWLKDTARIAVDSTSRLLKRLEVPELKIEETQTRELRLESDRDLGGGYDPYGGSNSGAGSPQRTPNTTPARGGRASPDPGGGYDPYGKNVTRKPGR